MKLQEKEIVFIEWGGSLERFYVESVYGDEAILKMFNYGIRISSKDHRRMIRTGKFVSEQGNFWEEKIWEVLFWMFMGGLIGLVIGIWL